MNRPRAEGLRPPSKLLLMAECRALGEFALGLATLPALTAAAPRGDGHTVLVLPGFLASDRSTDFLRAALRRLGFNAVGWRLGRNLGGIYAMRDGLQARIRDLHRESGRRVSVVGWSLGGVYARDLALMLPDHVRGVISMGSPFSGDIRANNVGRLYDIISGERVGSAPPQDLAAIAGHLPVPATSIYSRSDGIVHWRTSLVYEHTTAENIEILGASHFGLGFNPAVLWAIADRLAQAEGTFRRFVRNGPFAAAYR